MAATVGSISIDLSTNAAKFSQGFKGAATTVERESARMVKAVGTFQGTIKTSALAISGFVGGLAAGALQQGISALTGSFGRAKEAIAELDEIATRSRAADLTTDSFQALAFAAKQANVEQGTFNKSLEIFTKNVGLAQSGTGSLYAELGKLNPQLLQSILNAGDQRERLDLVADALSNTTDKTQQAAIATTIFGKSGAALIPVLEGGARSLAGMEQEAKKLGITFDKELFEKAGALDDQLDVLSTAIDVQFKSALINLGPVLVGGAESMAALAKGINDLTVAVNNFADNPSLDSFDKLRQKLITIDIEPGSFADNIRQAFSQSADDIRSNIDLIEADIEVLKAKITEDKALNVDTSSAEAYLKRLQHQVDELRLELQEEMKVDIDTSGAEAKLAGLSFRAAEIASMKLLEEMHGQLPRVTGSNLRRPGSGNTTSTLTPTGNTVTVTKFGQDDKAILQDINDSIDDNADAQSQGFDRVSGATSDAGGRVSDTVTLSSQRLSGDFDSYMRGQTSALLGGFDRLESAIESSGILSGGTATGSEANAVLGGGTLKQQLNAAGLSGGQRYTSSTSGVRLVERDEMDLRNRLYAGKFADGGSFVVPGGSPSGDRNLVTLLANSGETVTVTKPGQSGNTYNLYYQAAQGENPQTARQNARVMLEFMQREMARA